MSENKISENHNKPNNSIIDNHSKIDAIKQLIFGENIKEYNSEFEAIKADILKKKKELESVIVEVRSELLESIDNLSTDVNIRITDLEDNLNHKVETLQDQKLDRNMLSELLINLGEKIKK